MMISTELPSLYWLVSSMPCALPANRKKLAAAKAIADLVSDEELNEDFIMPEPFDPRVSDVVSQAVKSHIEA